MSQKFCQFFLSSFLSSAQKRNVVHVRHTFVCRAVDTFCVEQLTFLKKVSSSQDSSRCISSSWPWLLIHKQKIKMLALNCFCWAPDYHNVTFWAPNVTYITNLKKYFCKIFDPPSSNPLLSFVLYSELTFDVMYLTRPVTKKTFAITPIHSINDSTNVT